LLMAGALGTSAMYRATVMRDVTDNLDGDLRQLIVTAEVDAATGTIELKEPGDARYDQTFSGRYWLVARVEDTGLTELARSASLYDETLMPTPEQVQAMVEAQGAILSQSGAGPTGESLFMRGRVVALDEVAAPLLFLTAIDVRPVGQDVRAFAATVVAAVSLLALLLMAGVFFQVRWGLAPLNRLRSDIEDIQKARRARLQSDVPREVEPLAAALNALIIDNAQSVERARDRAGNLAHGLKTPLAILHNALEEESDPTRRKLIADQLRAMQDIIERHLRSARASATARLPDQLTDLDETLLRLRRAVARMHGDKPPPQLGEPSGISLAVAQHDLDDILGNLLDNAMKYGAHRVEVGVENDEHRCVIHIDDDGPGLTRQERAQALQRGLRLDETAKGSGLGLAIVQELVEAYRGALTLSESPIGGLRVTVRLPLTAAPLRVD
jgi:signal transduction histidine kinase